MSCRDNLWDPFSLVEKNKKAGKVIGLCRPPKIGCAPGIRTPITRTRTACPTIERGRSTKLLAEREGFEPSVGRKPHNSLAGCHLRPLGHLSALLPCFYFRIACFRRRVWDSNPQGLLTRRFSRPLPYQLGLTLQK